MPLLSLSPDDRRLISASIKAVEDESIIVWDIGDSISQAAVLECPKDLAACAWSPDGALIAAVTFGGTVRVWDGKTLQQLGQLDGMLRDGKMIDLFRCGFEPPDPPWSTCVQFSPDARYLAWALTPRSYHCSIWKPRAGEQPTSLPPHTCDDVTQCESRHTHATPGALAFDPEGRRIATAHEWSYSRPTPEECAVRVWDVATGAILATLTGHTECVMAVSFSPDGSALLSISRDGSVRIWDALSGEHRMTLGGNSAPIAAACFSPCGEYVATGSRWKEQAARLWRMDDGSCVAVFPVFQGCAHHIAFSPNGESLALGTPSGIVHIHRLSDIVGHKTDDCRMLKVD
ncbi:hypothetical protein GSI_04280 [Ganoderma sinense ZZ0214-1]|uniref:Uncharacterized protein n=1 Tax=Ganoderma sinense ZZ0214-1 TaxID=1077348 RepID=A0A2G8SIV9_9APHY|nr:hypothetical protein GSI_04280 [Ganoderma sinense ZZ0214-1]